MSDPTIKARLEALETCHYANALRTTLSAVLADIHRPTESRVMRSMTLPIKVRKGIVVLAHFALWSPPPVQMYHIRELIRDVHVHTLAKLNLARKDVVGMERLEDYGIALLNAAQKTYRLEEYAFSPLASDQFDKWMKRHNAAVDALLSAMDLLPDNLDLSQF